ncbi:NAD(P)-binding protein, partial [Bimuria novae-zelandiae CBS 107.79]
MTRTVFIVGSSSGIGLEIVRIFFSNGWNVVAVSRNPEASKDLLDLQVQDIKRLLLVPIELTKPETFQPALDTAVKTFGSIEVLVNNAGVNVLGAFELLSQEKLRKQFEVNFFGPAEITRLAIPHLRRSSKAANKDSIIINIGSGCSLNGIPLFSYYTSSKFAVDGLAEVLHHELGVQNIIVKNVIPAG